MNFIYIVRTEFHNRNWWAGLVTSLFPVVPLLFRNMGVARVPHNSSNWRCQTGQSHQACLYVCPMLLLLTEGKMCHYLPSRLKGQPGWPPGREEEFPGFISGFGKEILDNTNRIWRKLYMWDSNVCIKIWAGWESIMRGVHVAQSLWGWICIKFAAAWINISAEDTERCQKMMASLISHLVGDREFGIWQKPWIASGSLSNKLQLPTAIAKERLPFHLNFAFRPFLGVIVTFYPLTSSHSTVQESDTGLFHDKFLIIGTFSSDPFALG